MTTVPVSECVKEADMADMMVRITSLETLHTDVKEIKQTVQEVRDLLNTWNSIKGFGITIKWIATAIKVITILTVAGIATYWFFTGRTPK